MKMTFETVMALQKVTGTRMLKVHPFCPPKAPKPGRIYQQDDVVFICVEGNVAIAIPPQQIEQMVLDNLLPSSCLPSDRKH